MIRAVEKVRERLGRAAAALKAAKVPYAVAGGNAVAAWVSRVDEAAVRYTQDVDILLRRADLEEAIKALTKAPGTPSTLCLRARKFGPITLRLLLTWASARKRRLLG
jgi:hypothetical protein